MHALYLAIFFTVYGAAFFGYSRWLAQRRIAAVMDPSQFGLKLRILAFAGVLSFAAAPPLAELAVRVLETNALDNLAFFAFVGAWLISAIPGVIVSRRTLKAAGINPDEEP